MAKKQKNQRSTAMASLRHAEWEREQKAHHGQLRRAWTQENKRAARSKKACRGKVQW